jgi:sulfur relay (sulfurtransferase) DsrC/TusE family protein
MKVKHLLEVLHNRDDNEEVMITFFLKDHADEMIAEQEEIELSKTEWSMAVARYTRNDYIDQDACEAYAEAVRSVIKERVKK